jgi:CDP-glucose 4,6-dehydratase
MLEGRKEFAEAWNFGPAEEGNATVGDIVAQIREVWPEICCESPEGGDQPHEAGMLRLECSKARTRLGWLPVWDSRRTVEKTVLWYRAFYEANRLRSGDDLQDYVAAARQKRLAWAAE